jgi:hypothetical protein
MPRRLLQITLGLSEVIMLSLTSIHIDGAVCKPSFELICE